MKSRFSDDFRGQKGPKKADELIFGTGYKGERVRGNFKEFGTVLEDIFNFANVLNPVQDN